MCIFGWADISSTYIKEKGLWQAGNLESHKSYL